MTGETVFLYHRQNDTGNLPVDKYHVQLINIDENENALKAARAWTEDNEHLYPVLRFGEDKIFATVFNPDRRTFARLMGDTTEAAKELPKPTVYHAGKCLGCERLKYWLTQRNIDFELVNIGLDTPAGDKLAQWSGGRRVVPTIDFPGVARFFNPPMELMERLVGLA